MADAGVLYGMHSANQRAGLDPTLSLVPLKPITKMIHVVQICQKSMYFLQ